MNNLAYLLALHSINGLGPMRLKGLLDRFRDPQIAWEANRAELIETGVTVPVADLLLQTRSSFDPQKNLQEITDSGIKILTLFDENYPQLLKQIYDPPVVLYYKGEADWNRQALAVVGTRKMTGYGRGVTEEFVKGLVAANLTIISGLARGVDTIAHKVAIESQGQTIAVLGGGLNNIYPPENRSLADKIISGFGAVISEFSPNEPSLAGNFPARNRIIAGLSLGVLVTEAAETSGSLITAKEALEQGKDIFATPGPITSELSRGPVSLIRDGAKAVFEAAEILEELGFYSQPKINFVPPSLSAEENKIWEILENQQLHIDDICRNVDLSISQVSAILLKMEIAGLVKNLGGGIYARV